MIINQMNYFPINGKNEIIDLYLFLHIILLSSLLTLY